MTDREKIKKYEKICIDSLNELGLNPEPHKIGIRKNLNHIGLCSKKTGDDSFFYIRLNRVLFDEGMDQNILLGTIAHELLHACTPCEEFFHHSETFMKYAKSLSEKGIYANMAWGSEILEKKVLPYMMADCHCGGHIQYAVSDGKVIGRCPYCGQRMEIQNSEVYRIDENGKRLEKLPTRSYKPISEVKEENYYG